jgi:CRISPR-associated protein Csm4
MATIKKLNLKLKSGLLSELHADMIFGHFAWRFKDKFGEEKLEEFLQHYENNEPIFTISDGLFEKEGKLFFPKPLKLTPAKFNATNKKERIIQFLKQKETKGKKLITLEELNLYLNGRLEEFEKALAETNVAPPQFVTDLRVSVEIDRETLRSKEGQLFAYHPKYLPEDTSIVILIKILNAQKWNEYSCEGIFKDVFEIGYGKKKSAGYGQFETIGNLEEFNGFEEPTDSNGFISLSHYLPANTDGLKDAYYDINVKYGKFGEEKSDSQNPFKPPMLFMVPGSCFITETKKDFYGRVIKGISDYLPKTIHYGLAFSLACKF